MPVALLTLDIAIEHAQSLKDRRQVVRSLKDKMRHGFNVSVAEMDESLVWNRATVAIAAVSSSRDYLQGQLTEAADAAERFLVPLGAQIIDSSIDLLD